MREILPYVLITVWLRYVRDPLAQEDYSEVLQSERPWDLKRMMDTFTVWIINRLGSSIDRALASSAGGTGFEPRPGHTKDFKNGSNCLSCLAFGTLKQKLRNVWGTLKIPGLRRASKTRLVMQLWVSCSRPSSPSTMITVAMVWVGCSFMSPSGHWSYTLSMLCYVMLC